MATTALYEESNSSQLLRILSRNARSTIPNKTILYQARRLPLGWALVIPESVLDITCTVYKISLVSFFTLFYSLKLTEDVEYLTGYKRWNKRKTTAYERLGSDDE